MISLPQEATVVKPSIQSLGHPGVLDRHLDNSLLSRMNTDSLSSDSCLRRNFNHKIDSKLLAYSKRINDVAFTAFGVIFFVDLVFFLVHSLVLRRVFIFPLVELLYFDVHNAIPLTLLLLNITTLCCVLYTHLQLHMRIDVGRVVKTLTMLIVFNVCGCMNSIFIVYPIAMLLNYTYYFPYKCRISFFINDREHIDKSTDRNDKYLRLIAMHHVLSKICYKLQSYTLNEPQRQQQQQQQQQSDNSINKVTGNKTNKGEEKKSRKNNTTIFDKLQKNLDDTLSQLCVLTPQEAALSSSSYRAEHVHNAMIDAEIKRYRKVNQVTFRVYSVAMNVSLLRLLFFSDGLDLYADHPWLWHAFWINIALQAALCLCFVLWCRCDAKLSQIKQNEPNTRLYALVLSAAQYKGVEDVLCDALLPGFYSCYEAWKYALDGPYTVHLLEQTFGKDISGVITEYIFEMKSASRARRGRLIMDSEKDDNDMVWNKVKHVLDGQQGTTF